MAVNNINSGNQESGVQTCRFCGAELEHSLVDLGMSPLCETLIDKSQLNNMEPFYPLNVYVCSHCFLVQLNEYVTPADIFSEYAYLQESIT